MLIFACKQYRMNDGAFCVNIKFELGSAVITTIKEHYLINDQADVDNLTANCVRQLHKQRIMFSLMLYR
jgi:hypothetical protein